MHRPIFILLVAGSPPSRWPLALRCKRQDTAGLKTQDAEGQDALPASWRLPGVFSGHLPVASGWLPWLVWRMCWRGRHVSIALRSV